MDSIAYLDDLIKEYFLFRGYIKTYTAFTSEKLHDKSGDQPDPDIIAEQLLNHIRQMELTEMMELWSTLVSRFFTHLPASYQPTIKLIETSIKRAYIVKVVRGGEKTKIAEFYDKFSVEMTTPGSEWELWFMLPHIKDPSSHPVFSTYFNKRWFHTLALSIKNFLTAAFREIPLPKLLAFHQERQERKILNEQIKTLKQELDKCRREIQQSKQTNNNNIQGTTAATNTPNALNPPTTTNPLVHSASQPFHKEAEKEKEKDKDLSTTIHAQTQIQTQTQTQSQIQTQTQANTGANKQSKPVNTNMLTTAVAPSPTAIPSPSPTPATAQPAQPQSHPHPHPHPHPQSHAGSSPSPSPSPSSALSSTPSSSSSSSSSSLDADFPHPVYSLVHHCSGHAHSSSSVRARFSTDGNKIATGGRDGAIKIWSIDRLTHLPTNTSTTTTTTAVPIDLLSLVCTVPSCSSDLTCLEWDGKNDSFIAYGSSDGKIRLLGVEGRKLIGEMDMTKEFPIVLNVACSPTDKYLVSAVGNKAHTTMEGGKGLLETWDLQTCRRSLLFSVDSVLSQINSLVFNHNGNMLVTAGADGMVRIYDMSTKKPIMGWPAHQGQVSAVKLCNEETTVISTGLDGNIIEWSLHQIGKVVRTFNTPQHTQHTYNAASASASVLPSPTGSTQAPILRAELALDWETEHFILSSSSSLFHPPPNNGQSSSPINSLYSSSAFIYTMSEPNPVQAISGHQGPVVSVDWHPSLPVIVTSGQDGMIRIKGMKLIEGRIPQTDKQRGGIGRAGEEEEDDGDEGDEEDDEDEDDDEEGEDEQGEGDEDDDEDEDEDDEAGAAAARVSADPTVRPSNPKQPFAPVARQR